MNIESFVCPHPANFKQLKLHLLGSRKSNDWKQSACQNSDRRNYFPHHVLPFLQPSQAATTMLSANIKVAIIRVIPIALKVPFFSISFQLWLFSFESKSHVYRLDTYRQPFDIPPAPVRSHVSCNMIGQSSIGNWKPICC
jgi:hypothetical protein